MRPDGSLNGVGDGSDTVSGNGFTNSLKEGVLGNREKIALFRGYFPHRNGSGIVTDKSFVLHTDVNRYNVTIL
jgi:hypothetical protein